MNVVKLAALAERWSSAKAAERANFQSYLIELCEALEVERPRPAGTGYEFEYPVKVISRDGAESSNFVDLFKRGHFVLEAKDQGAREADSLLLRKAYGQARTYTAAVDGGLPPYVMVLDVGRTLLVWDRWDGSYGGFSAARKVNLATLAQNEDDRALIRDIFEDPAARDPRVHAVRVTRETAQKLADLAASLEGRGHSQEVVGRFLMRCVFTMFAEDVGLLPDNPFTKAVEEIGFVDPNDFAVALRDLWKAMDEGSRFGLRKFLRFNGHFFKDQTVLDLTREDLAILHAAAKSSWADVEPTIMGTLLTRALDPVERHRLGAEYTPREFVERVVRPTVEEPIRERWTAVQAEVLQVRGSSAKSERVRRDNDKTALARLREFHSWLRSLRFLDPACGSGNFLYVTLAIVKQIELEVLRTIEEITGSPELAVEEVGPWQFHGIEIKAWAREIAELTLWVGYHQWWRRTHGHTQPPEPVLRDTGTLEHRDAVLDWSSTTIDESRARPDPTPRIADPVTGKPVPDPTATLPYVVYQDAEQAAWPEADFIVGNPPYMGLSRQRDAFGDGYIDALRHVYGGLLDSADYVMYWWHRAAMAIAGGRTVRAGLITTNSITQGQNRRIIEHASEMNVQVAWAIPDHPWVDETGSADVRVAMTVLARDPKVHRLLRVNPQGAIVSDLSTPRLNADLTAHADVAGASSVRLHSNEGLSSDGVKLHGKGFIVPAEEAAKILEADPAAEAVLKPYRNGRDIAQRPRNHYVIDFALMDEAEARAYPVLFDIVRSRVKPDRDANKRQAYRTYWWRFGEPRREFRAASAGLARYIATVDTARYRYFLFLDAHVVSDDKLVLIASDDPYHLGVLSSSIHVTWANAAGGKLGIGNDPVYVKTRCFDPYPFPDATPDQKREIGRIATEIDSHRRNAVSRDPRVTFTAMYAVVEKLRRNEALEESERDIYQSGACGVLRDLHDELDRAVADAYGWAWPSSTDEILDRLVTLHDVRVAEEAAGTVKWLRSGFQQPRSAVETAPALDLPEAAPSTASAETAEWPTTAVEQITAVQGALAKSSHTIEDMAKQFRGARRDLIGKHLEILALMGEVRRTPDGLYHVVKAN